ncbi:MAG: nickel pincer cofactor biosynthesis protein LarC [Chloroflexi bacterium]|nr:nickel pincer cofactor biosynthesis protein LarC [Chloroflexota bacterium]
MSKIAYFDCFSGCSGDMILGALLDAGFPLDTLRSGLSSLDFHGYELSAEKVTRASLTATKFNVNVDSGVHQHQRSLSEILGIIESSQLSGQVKKTSSAVFQRLGEVEAKIHGVALEEVHFHEIGAVDSIVDIVGSAIAFEWFGLEQFFSSPLPLGSGTVKTAHGTLPVPAPATLQLLTLAGAPVEPPKPGMPQGELLTPTGAALVTVLSSFGRPEMSLDRIGYGAGSKNFESWPNIVRIWLGEKKTSGAEEQLILLETNIDDMSPQIYGYLMDKLFAEKAADVWFTPIQMKKNRPAIMLSVLAPSFTESRLTEIILRETTTLGMRVRTVSRHTAQREIITFDSSLGPVQTKVKRFQGDVISLSPEYEDCRRIAQEREMPLQEVLRIVQAELGRLAS